MKNLNISPNDMHYSRMNFDPDYYGANVDPYSCRYIAKPGHTELIKIHIIAVRELKSTLG